MATGRGRAVLTNGEVPDDADQPSANFFFAPGSDGGVLALDLGSVREVMAVNSYSWHPQHARAAGVHALREATARRRTLTPSPSGLRQAHRSSRSAAGP